jgi:PPOX class probable F420-dependent enzyme
MGMSPLNVFAREKYLSLTTYRRDGSPVATPVWFVVDENRLLVWTSAASWKAKRLRRDRRVRIAPCDFRGNIRGAAFDATARFLSESEGPRVQRLLLQKYPVARRLLSWFTALVARAQRAPRERPAYIEIPLPEPSQVPA